MQAVTIGVTAVASLFAWRATPVRMLCIYFAVLLLYPQFLTVKLGVADFTTGRILILVLYARLILNSRLLQAISWTWLDRLVLIGFLAQCTALLFNVPVKWVAESEGGRLIDVVLVYFAVRATVTTPVSYTHLTLPTTSRV